MEGGREARREVERNGGRQEGWKEVGRGGGRPGRLTQKLFFLRFNFPQIRTK